MLNYDFVNKTLLQNKIRPYTYKLLFYLLAISDEELRIPKIYQKDMAAGAGCSRQNVNLGLRQFVEIDVIKKDNKGYYFNSELFSK